jgi:Spy/CpxP family protein refolding chaperone
MSRLRITLMSAAMMVALAALTLNSLAQPPGRNGGGPGGGPGGFGRGGGPGGFGGPGGSLLSLASNPAVQEDMKVKDKQKAQIKSLNDKFGLQSREIWGQMGGGPGGPGGGPNAQGKGGRRQGQNGQGIGNGQANGQVAQGNGGFGGGDDGQVQDPNAPGVNPNQGQGGGGGGGGGRGNRGPGGQQDPERAQQFAMMREAMNELTQSAEASLGKILDKTQVNRLKQIQLQLQGPGVILREDMMEKLGIDESQIQMLEEVRSEHRVAQRDNGRARQKMMRAVFEKANPNPNNGQNGDDAENGGQGANNGDGNGRNGGRRGRPNPEAMKKAMEDPQVQAQMEQMRTQDDKLENQFSLAIAKVLTPRQRALYKKMLGAPFDRSKMGGGGPWGGPRGNGPGNNPATAKAGATATKTASTAKANPDDDAEEAAPAATPAPAKAKAKATTAVPRKKSLRELRGSSDSNDQ